MIIKNYIPHPDLQPYVETMVVLEGESPAEVCNFYPSVHPVICVDISRRHFREFNGSYGNYTIGMAGLLDRYIQVDHVPDRVVQVVLKPFGAYRFLGIPLNRLSQWGNDITELVKEAQNAIAPLQDYFEDDRTCIHLLESLLMQRLRKLDMDFYPLDEIAYACNEIKRSSGAIKIRELSYKVNMSEGRFRLHFTEKTGLSPKHFCFIEKFNQINQLLKQGQVNNWMDLVDRFNFYDQNHFIKDFKRFFGCTPSQYATTNLISVPNFARTV